MTTTEQSWAWMQTEAESSDADAVRLGYGPPPILSALVAAAAGTRLSRLYPYTSHSVLRFATRPDHWRADAPEPPVSIGIATDPDEYIVWWGQLLGDFERPTVVLMTADQHEAVGLAELMLDAWPFSYPARPLTASCPFWVDVG